MLKQAQERKTKDGSRTCYQDCYQNMVGSDPLPNDLVEKMKADGPYDLILSSACMIKGHFPNTCYNTFLECMKPGAEMIFTIRDIYINSETDSGMNFHGALDKLEKEDKVIQKIDQIHYTKYKGLNFLGIGHQEEGANVMIYKKL